MRLNQRAYSPMLGTLIALTHLQDAFGGSLSLGIGCSGADLVVVVFSELYSTLNQAIDMRIVSTHIWSCERDTIAQKCILEVSSPSKIFIDTSQMRNYQARC